MLVTACYVSLMAAAPTATPATATRVDSAGARRTELWLAQAAPEPDPGAEPVPPAGPGPGRSGLRDIIRRGPGGKRPLPGMTGMPAGAPDLRAAAAPSAQAPAQPAPPPGGAAPAPAPAPARPAAPPPQPAPAPAAGPNGQNGQNGGEGINFEERARKGKFSFDFSKAEIIDVVKAISDMKRINFIVPENIKSQRITILSPTKITADEAYQVFLAALEVNGISIVKSGRFYKLLQSKDAMKEPVPTCIGPDDTNCPKFSEQIVTMILPLAHVDAQQLSGVIKTLMSKDSELQVFQPTNSLIVSEYAHNLTRVRRVIESLDVPGFEDELQIVQIQYATATEIADKLTQVFEVAKAGPGAPVRPGAASARPTRGGDKPADPASSTAPSSGSGSGGDDADVQISKIVPDDRTNQLIIKANRRSFDAIKRLIGKLDIPAGDSGRVHVYYLENASAEELASTLSALSQGQPSRQARPQGAPMQPPGAAGQARPGGAESAVLFEGEVKISSDKATNSLIIISSGRDFRAISRIIEQLDRPRRQVYVEAAILEVTINDKNEFGLNYHAPIQFSESDLGGEGGPGTIGFVQSAYGSGGLSPTLTALSPEGLLGIVSGSIVGIVGKGLEIPVGDSTITIPSFGVVLRWLQTSSNAKILSTPHILTTDNEEASIEVGQKIPFQRGTSLPSIAGLPTTGTTTGAGASNLLSSYGSLFSSVDRIDVSLKLTLTPQINERGKIRLEIDQQIEDVVGADEATKQPITANRAAKTVVVVDDQQTVVLGGLMRDRARNSDSKFPILGDLPIIGWLFKQHSKEIEKVNLLLVLTPYIIRDSNDFQTIFERKIQEYEAFAAEYYGDTATYRAHIDYSRKSGPLARMVQRIRRESEKLENGGGGDASDTIVTPPGGDESGEGGQGGQGGPGEGAAPDGSGQVPSTLVPVPMPDDGSSGGGLEGGGGGAPAEPPPEERE